MPAGREPEKDKGVWDKERFCILLHSATAMAVLPNTLFNLILTDL